MKEKVIATIIEEVKKEGLAIVYRKSTEGLELELIVREGIPSYYYKNKKYTLEELKALRGEEGNGCINSFGYACTYTISTEQYILEQLQALECERFEAILEVALEGNTSLHTNRSSYWNGHFYTEVCKMNEELVLEKFKYWLSRR